MDSKRRQLLIRVPLIGADALLVGCRRSESGGASNEKETKAEGGAEPADVTATEDLMREHGILRRALLVYKECATRMRQDLTSVPPEHLEKTAQLFRVFGEEYHEKKLEETHIFPTLKKTPNPAAVYADVLIAQHARGREITDYLLAQTAGDKIPAASGNDFVNALEAFVRMYEHHAAVEDTLVFPEWNRPSADDRAVVYQKGALALHELRQQMGDAAFWAALRDYTRTHAGQTVRSADLQRAFEGSSGRDLRAFFDEWVYAR